MKSVISILVLSILTIVICFRLEYNKSVEFREFVKKNHCKKTMLASFGTQTNSWSEGWTCPDGITYFR